MPITTTEIEDNDAVDIPVFQCNRVMWRDGIERLAFVCPKCGKTNIHTTNPEDSDGHRHSHCKCWGSEGYYIEEAEVTYRKY